METPILYPLIDCKGNVNNYKRNINNSIYYRSCDSCRRLTAESGEISLYPLSKNGQTLSQGKESRHWTGMVISKTQNTQVANYSAAD